jgi:hypothetical protein
MEEYAQKNIRIASDAVTESRTFLQEAILPHDFATPHCNLQVLLLTQRKHVPGAND